jgi:chemotaxis protein methyltransferase CheR
MTWAAASRKPAPIIDGEFPMMAEDFSAIAALVYDEAGIHMGDGKTSLVYSRLTRRLRALGLSTFAQYVALVSAPDSGGERSRMVAALTTNFTRFFREEHHFTHLKTDVVTPIVASLRQGRRLRIWSAGCSRGHEPYTIAMSILEIMPDAGSFDVKILATDINGDVLAQAQAGIYDEAALADVPKAARERWFQETGAGHRVNDEVRRLVAFRPLNLMLPSWPMRGRFDVIFCRNVAIYFDEETQDRLWAHFAEILVPGGHLYIGHSERLGGPAASAFAGVGITAYQLIGRTKS